MMREVEYLVANNGRDWCVIQAGTVQGRYPMRQEAVRGRRPGLAAKQRGRGAGARGREHSEDGRGVGFRWY